MNALAGTGSVRLAVLVRPGAPTDSVAWDVWRNVWTVRCRAKAIGGEANESVRRRLAEWLGVPSDSVRWIRAGRSPSKLAEVRGLAEAEVHRRLERAAAGSSSER